MFSAYAKLHRVLTLELSQGCRDRAVIGGLGRFAVLWRQEADADARQSGVVPPPLASEVERAFSGYAEASLPARRLAVEQILALIVPYAAASQTPPSPTADPAGGIADARHEDTRYAPPQTRDTVTSPGDYPGQTGHPSVRRPRVAPASGPDLDAPVTALRGVSTVYAKRLERLGIATVRDLLYHFPRRYDDYAQLRTIGQLRLGEDVTVIGTVRRIESQQRGPRSIVRALIGDQTGLVEVTWFNQRYLVQALTVGREVVISGTVDRYLGRLHFTAPEWEPLRRDLLHTGRLVPVYPLTEGITGRWMRRLTRAALTEWGARVSDPLPAVVRESVQCLDLATAVRQMHFPDSHEALAQARRRLGFDELFMLQMGLMRRRRQWQAQEGYALAASPADLARFRAGLPFTLTGAQERAMEAILGDMLRPTPMNRLLQGDVGSGKTVVAAAAIQLAVSNGLQAAVMAPTSILAQQHYHTLQTLLSPFPDARCRLLVGSLPVAEKQRIQDEAASGEASVLVGTHALIQEAVSFERLGLAIVDEQHRFGVLQRSALVSKSGGRLPHMLVMSATPIPRTLALTVYGDLDVTTLDELPPHRQTVVTAVRESSSRERIYAFVLSQVQEGRQAFVICPLVQESEHTEAKAAVAEHRRLQEEVFPDLRVALLHGRMSADEKDKVMGAFSAGEYDILVSTAVVEVGIDVPNATVMLIEGAERFGLAQLHQFRGRVGRGEARSYCILLSDDPSEESLKRLAIMEETTDGFVLAEKDLQMRGPGDFVGVRQHGLPELKVARLSDRQVLELARMHAEEVLSRDADLSHPENRPLAAAVQRFWLAVGLS